jgi:signal transduction histidine kinase/ActR/RegA family two-component response regulator/HAMP domain-containing protein
MKFGREGISIKQKLTLIIMATSTVAILLVSAGLISFALHTFRETTVRNVSTLADIIGNRSIAALSFDDQADALEDLNCLRSNKGIMFACLYKKDAVFARYPVYTDVKSFPRPERDGVRFEGDRLIMFREIKHRGEQLGTLYIVSDIRELRARLELYAGIIALFVLAALGVTFALSSRLQRVITRPIFHLAQTARTVSLEKNYSLRAKKEANDELGQLVDRFNEMLTQIQEQDAALQQANDKLEKWVHERTQDLELEIVERKRAEAAIQLQLIRISLLNQITHAISERQDLESSLNVVLRQLEDRLSIDMGALFLCDSQPATLNLAAVRVRNPLLVPKLDLPEGTVIQLDQTGLLACQAGQTVYVSDTVKEGALLLEKLARAGLRSAAALPLMVENKLFGVLLVARLKANDFAAGECEFLRTLADHVALAAHQAQLHGELEKAYNELRQTQQTVMQQERLKALGQMASGIAHDINNALSPVVGFGDLLGRSEPGLSENGKKYLRYIKTAGEDIAHIVARLREFYRRRDEREALQEVQLNQLAEQVIDMTRPRWRDIPQSRGITVEVEANFDGACPKLVGIESEFREALTNLILNAVDALPHGGKITVRTTIGGRDYSAPETRVPTHAILEVTDTGVGMDDETQKHCLEPFFSTKGKRGTGLGLAMVYGVMERHEGKIEIESRLGRGTTVRLVFPVRRTTAGDVRATEALASSAPLQILCIDDEPLLRELLKEILEREGHLVEVTDGGHAGVEAFRAAQGRGSPFDVVITDLGMPYVDGRQVAKMLKRESPTTPVIMLTGWGAFMKADGDLPSQIDGILSKPPRTRELRETLLRVAARPAAKVISTATTV